jgi:hypothetical protein
LGGTPPPARRPRTERLAVAALVLALVAFLVPVIPAIIALVLAAKAAGRIQASQGALAGTGTVLAARVVATGALVLVPLGILAGAGLVALLPETTEAGDKLKVAAWQPGRRPRPSPSRQSPQPRSPRR